MTSVPGYVRDAAIRLHDVFRTEEVYSVVGEIMREAFTAGRDLRGKVAVCSKGRPGLVTGAKLLPWGPSWVGIGLDDGPIQWASRDPFVITDDLNSWIGRYLAANDARIARASAPPLNRLLWEWERAKPPIPVAQADGFDKDATFP